MTAAIWSACPGKVLEMPARFLLQFFHNHGLLQLSDRPQWKTIPGGACRYVAELLRPLGDRVRLNTPVASVNRGDEAVVVRTRDGEQASFDAVVFACHSDQALRMLSDVDGREREVLEYFPYQHNLAIVHTDTRLLPRRRAAWASWNYRILPGNDERVSVTYDVNRLQRLGAPGPVCVTLNDEETIDPSRVLARIDYHHPVFQPGTLRMQQAQHELNGRRRTYFCGAYWGYGFHEDGVRSALAVVDAIGRATQRDDVSRLEGQRA
jgi:predicted NAD/FAD-binding protein